MVCLRNICINTLHKGDDDDDDDNNDKNNYYYNIKVLINAEVIYLPKILWGWHHFCYSRFRIGLY
jgi:hypothetical protein